jgi:hypothetical protein
VPVVCPCALAAVIPTVEFANGVDPIGKLGG